MPCLDLGPLRDFEADVHELAHMNAKVMTGDGSATLRSERFGATYHSMNGAQTESRHVFIEQGLEAIGGEGALRVLEVGFGTGLNAALAWAWAKRTGRRVEYLGLEAFPVEAGEMELQVEGLSTTETNRLVANEHWDEPLFSFAVVVRKLQEWTPPQDAFDVIFFDAFAPSTQPELWSSEVFESLICAVVEGGRLVTYCAKGTARQAMRAAGWRVERAPGPPGKREMTLAFREPVTRFNVRAYGLILNEAKDHVLTCKERLLGGEAIKFPGGGVEYGEGPEGALMRELAEELGPEIADGMRLGQHAYTTGFYMRSRFNPSDQILSIYYFVHFEFPNGLQRWPIAPNEPVTEPQGEVELQWRWVPLRQIDASQFTFPIDQYVVREILAPSYGSDSIQ